MTEPIQFGQNPNVIRVCLQCGEQVTGARHSFKCGGRAEKLVPIETEPIHVLSTGAGVQSSVAALMAAAGEIKPMPVAGIFADTKAEPKSVYLWLDWLEKQLPFPIIRVSKGDLTADSLRMRTRTKYAGSDYTKTNIPTYILNPNGTRGIVQRQCTYDYKVIPIVRECKRLMEQHGASKAVQWIGISLDEVSRMKDSREKNISHRWPLVELGMKRHDCLRWMERKGFPKPPRSACVYCPFHSDAEWRRLKLEEPDEFDRAVKFEVDLQSQKAKTDNMKGIPFLHNSMKLLSTIDFASEEEKGQIDMFQNDCTGHCGV